MRRFPNEIFSNWDVVEMRRFPNESFPNEIFQMRNFRNEIFQMRHCRNEIFPKIKYIIVIDILNFWLLGVPKAINLISRFEILFKETEMKTMKK